MQAGPAVNESVRRVLLPPEAACISFGHFLELGLGLEDCLVHGRPLHRKFARYLGIGPAVACFHYEDIGPNSVLMPPEKISYSLPAQQHWLEEEVEELIEVRTAPATIPERKAQTGITHVLEHQGLEAAASQT